MKCKDYYLNASFLSQEMITSKTVILNKFTFFYIKKKVNQGTSQLLPTHKIEYLILQPVTLIKIRGSITRFSFRVHMEPCVCVNHSFEIRPGHRSGQVIGSRVRWVDPVQSKKKNTKKP
jgi:hypothetical protein